MSMSEKKRHINRNGESKAHSLAHKYDGRKMATVVNHNHFERHHGYESTRHKEKKTEEPPMGG
ncbi:MAG TPA: hypothetical protein VLF69_03280 [Candidatus Saccharimonadales bacterium]|nr:hypothetical protein [Candidatus Saccharimonadales bacterium]